MGTYLDAEGLERYTDKITTVMDDKLEDALGEYYTKDEVDELLEELRDLIESNS